MANYGFHEDCHPPMGCGDNCPYNTMPKSRTPLAQDQRRAKAPKPPKEYKPRHAKQTGG